MNEQEDDDMEETVTQGKVEPVMKNYKVSMFIRRQIKHVIALDDDDAVNKAIEQLEDDLMTSKVTINELIFDSFVEEE